jgi:hypothetical protein
LPKKKQGRCADRETVSVGKFRYADKRLLSLLVTTILDDKGYQGLCEQTTEFHLGARTFNANFEKKRIFSALRGAFLATSNDGILARMTICSSFKAALALTIFHMIFFSSTAKLSRFNCLKGIDVNQLQHCLLMASYAH